MPDKLRGLLKARVLLEFGDTQNFRTEVNHLINLSKPWQKPYLENILIYYTSLLRSNIDVFEDTIKYKEHFKKSSNIFSQIHNKYKSEPALKLANIINYKLEYVHGVRLIRRKYS